MRWRDWFLFLAVVTLASATSALALDAWLASAMRPPDDFERVELTSPQDPPLEAAPTAAEATEPPPTLDDYRTPIVERSIFDSSRVGGTPEEIVEEDGEQPVRDLDAELVLTSVSLEPRWSTALIREGRKDPLPSLYAVGDALADAIVESIERRRVYLRRDTGALEYLEIGAEPARSKKKSSRSKRTNWSEGVEKVDDTHFVIDRDMLDQAMGNMSALSRAARVRPKKKGGQYIGYRLYRIRTTGPLKPLGLRNNDVVTAVNGMSITSPDQALKAFNTLQTASTIELEIERKGKPMTIEYEIQ